MNFEFFAFLVFMSFVSFATAFLAYGMVVRFMGKEGFASKLAQIILVPACIVIFNFITIAVPQSYRYLVGSLPILLCVGVAFYYRFVRGETFDEKTPMQLANAQAEPKKFSKKSARIHAARDKRHKK